MGLTRKVKAGKVAVNRIVGPKHTQRATPRALPGISTSGATPVWHGSSAVEMQPGSPDILVDEGGQVVTTLLFAGKRAALATDRPARGAIISGYDGRVVSTRLRPGNGDKAVLTVVLKTREPDEPEDPGELEETWEIDWRSVEKPLVTNPKIVAQGSGTTQVVVDEVEAWRNSPQQRKRGYQIPLVTLTREPQPDDDADWQDLAGEALAVAKKIAAGIESWLEFSPVIMRIRIFGERPASTGGAGVIGTPTVSVAGYVYLKTGDNLVQQANREWRQTETWQGSASWDTDLYEAAGA